MTDLVVALKIQGDASSGADAAQRAREAIAGIGQAGQEAGAAATAGLAQVEASLGRVGASAAEVSTATVASNDAMSASFIALTAQYDSLIAKQSEQAASLAEVTASRAAYGEALRDGILLESEYEKGLSSLSKQEDFLIAQRERSASAVAALVGKYAGASGAAEKLAADEATLNEALKAGTVSAEAHAAALAGIGAKRVLLEEEAAAAGAAAGAFSKLHVETAGVTQEVSRLGSEALRGNFQRMESSAVVLAQRMGLLGLVFSGAGLAIIGVAAVVGTVIAAFIKGSEELSQLNRDIIATGNYAGVTASQIESLGSRMGESNGRIRESREALQLLLASGRATGDQFKMLAQGAVDFSIVTGESIQKAVETFQKIGEEPVRASLKLNEQYHFLTVAVYEQIAAAEKDGNVEQAAAIAQQALADASAARAQQIKQNLGLLEQAWNGLKLAAKDAWDAMLNIGRESSIDDQIKEVSTKLAQAQGDLINSQDHPAFLDKLFGVTDRATALWKAQVTDLQAQLDTLNTRQMQQSATDAGAAVAGVSAQIQQEGVEGVAALNKLGITTEGLTSKQEKLKEAASALYKIYQAGGVLPPGVDFNGPLTDQPEGSGWDKIAASILKDSAAAREAAKDTREFNAEMATLNQSLAKGINVADDLANQYSGPLEAANQKYTKQINELAAAMDALDAKAALDKNFAASPEYAALWKQLADAVANAGDKIQLAQEKATALKAVQIDEGDAVAQLTQKYTEEEQALQLGADASVRVTAELAAEKEMRAAIVKAIQEGNSARADELRTELDSLLHRSKAHADYMEVLKQEQSVIHDWEQIAENSFNSAFSTINKDIIEGGSVMSDLKNVAKQTVEAILMEFEKLAVIGPLMNALFGTNMPTLSTAQGALGLLGGNGSGIGSLLGGGGGAGGLIQSFLGNGTGGGGIIGAITGNSSSGLDTLSNINSGASAGNGIFGWLFGSSDSSAIAGSLGDGTLGGTNWGGFANSPSYGVDYGAGEAGSYTPGAGTGVGSGAGLGTWLGIAGGVLAGYNEYQAAGGGLGGALGAASYGIGSIALGGAALGALGGVGGGLAGIGAGAVAGEAGATAGAAGALGASSGVMAAIPVVGWIALAAMAINMISGGKLFGTGGSPIGGNQTESIGPDGANVSTEMTFKGQHALFGGSYYKEHQLATDPAAIAAANALQTAEKSSTDALATSLGTKLVDIVSGTFTTSFDKKGTVTGTSDTVLGQTYKGETQQQFAERLQADDYLKVLDSMGLAASKFVAGVQGNADKLFAAVQDYASVVQAAQADVAKGMGLLGKSDTSLANIMSTVTSLQQGTDTLAQTYTRLQGEQADLTATMSELGLTTGKTGADFVTFADQLTAAAGGLQNLDKLWADFFKNFYSASEQATNTLAADQQHANDALAAIGEDTGVSMAKFRADFAAALPNLTPAQAAQWLLAAEALAQVNTAMDSLAASKQKYADYEVQTQGDAFTQAMAKVVASENSQIATANQLAQAAGLAGASQQDLAVIMRQGSVQLGQALAALATGIANDVQSLYPSVPASDPSGMFTIYNAGRAAADAAAAKQAQQAQTAYDLIVKIGDYSFASGGGIAATLKQFGLTPDELAKTLGVSVDQVNKQLKSAEDSAAALTKLAAQGTIQTGLLTDMLDVLQGKKPTFDISTLGAPTVSTAAGGKIGPGNNFLLPPGSGTAQPGAAEVVTAVKKGNDVAATANATLASIDATLKKLLSGSMNPVFNRNGRAIGTPERVR